jgi:hypothetical protein
LRQFLNAGRATWWTFVDGITRGNRFCIRPTTLIAAFGALRLRQHGINAISQR